MASEVDICNMALAHYGGIGQVASIDPPDGSVEAGRCARFYPIARRELLDAGSWTWAKKRTLLAQVTNPSTVWTYAYQLPSDCMNARRVLQQQFVQADPAFWPYTQAITYDQLVFFEDRGSADFQIEGTTLLTHEPQAVLLYTIDVIDTGRYSPAFVTALSYLLASYLVGPTIKGRPGAQAAGQYREIARNIIRDANATNANNSADSAEYFPDAMRVRR